MAIHDALSAAKGFRVQRTESEDCTVVECFGRLTSENVPLLKEAMREAIADKSLFQALDKRTYIRVDFHVGHSIPGEFDRSKIEEVFPGVFVPLVSREDAILSKLLWIKMGSHKSRQDVQMMLARKNPIDEDYLNQQAMALGVTDLLAELKSSQVRS